MMNTSCSQEYTILQHWTFDSTLKQAASISDKPESSLPSGQICNYVCDNESGKDFRTSIYNIGVGKSQTTDLHLH